MKSLEEIITIKLFKNRIIQPFLKELFKKNSPIVSLEPLENENQEEICNKAWDLLPMSVWDSLLDSRWFFKKYVKEMMEKNVKYFTVIPDEMKTEKMCLELINKRRNYHLIEYFPERLLNDDEFYLKLCLKVIRDLDFESFEIPEKLNTRIFYLELIKQECWAIEFVPIDIITNEFYMEAVKQDPSMLTEVPDIMMSPEMCMEAVKQDGQVLDYIPDLWKTFEICLEAVRQNGYALEYVPENMKSKEMCIEAVKKSGGALEYVLEEFKTFDLCMKAVKQDGRAIEYVPENMKSKEMYRETVKQNGRVDVRNLRDDVEFYKELK